MTSVPKRAISHRGSQQKENKVKRETGPGIHSEQHKSLETYEAGQFEFAERTGQMRLFLCAVLRYDGDIGKLLKSLGWASQNRKIQSDGSDHHKSHCTCFICILENKVVLTILHTITTMELLRSKSLHLSKTSKITPLNLKCYILPNVLCHPLNQ